MKTDQIMYPVWRGSIVIPKSQFSLVDKSESNLFLLEYKYVIVERRLTDNLEILVRWENLETPSLNRRLYLSGKSTLKILDEEGKC